MRFAVVFVAVFGCAFAFPALEVESETQELVPIWIPNVEEGTVFEVDDQGVVDTFEVQEVTYDDNADWRVVGGSNAASGQFPHIVSLRRASHFCGGTIISNVWIISAAHCTIGAAASAIVAVAGTTTLNSGGVRYALSRIINHPQYSTSTLQNDISMLRTSSTIAFGSLVSSLAISSGTVGGGQTVTLSGWGRTSAGSSLPNNLQFIRLATITNNDCASRVGGNPIFASSLCTFTRAGQGACNGDSGGPLVLGNILVGAVSWGFPCAIGRPDVYARVSSYVSWIQSNA